MYFARWNYWCICKLKNLISLHILAPLLLSFFLPSCFHSSLLFFFLSVFNLSFSVSVFLCLSLFFDLHVKSQKSSGAKSYLIFELIPMTQNLDFERNSKMKEKNHSFVFICRDLSFNKLQHLPKDLLSCLKNIQNMWVSSRNCNFVK